MSVDESAGELLTDALVFEYLKQRGLGRTAEVYSLETKRKYPNLVDADSLSTQLWVSLRQRLGINEEKRQQADAAAKMGRTPQTKESTLEVILRRTLSSLNGTQDSSASKQADSSASPPVDDGASEGTVDSKNSQLSLATRKKKKKKAKSRKYQSPAYQRDVAVNHNLKFHQLGRPVHRRGAPKLSADGDGFELQKSREHWMPMELRLKMLKRDMMLAQQYQRDVNDWKYRKEKNSYKTDEHTRRKTLKELTKRGSVAKSTCALCEHGFLELPFGVSYKAIMDLRRTWGVEVTPSSKYYKFTLIPHCYETVHVCVFCSQFFGLEFFDGDRQKAVGV